MASNRRTCKINYKLNVKCVKKINCKCAFKNYAKYAMGQSYWVNSSSEKPRPCFRTFSTTALASNNVFCKSSSERFLSNGQSSRSSASTMDFTNTVVYAES